MLFKPQKYSIKDEKSVPFIDPKEITDILGSVGKPSVEEVMKVIEASFDRQRLSLSQVAVLLNSEGDDCEKLIFDAARKLKKEIYGERIVLFAPLYIGNDCVNNCLYCGFKRSNSQAVRRTLTDVEIAQEVRELEKQGQKRLILVYGEHPKYDPEYIAHTVKLVYATNRDANRINRVNINAAPFDIDGFHIIKEAGIGTYQIFQETYDPETYKKHHPSGPKSDYEYRLTALDRAIEAGIDDVGLGVLLGLRDWRFEIMALVRHTNHLEACFNMGPHTISFPRIQNASNLDKNILQPVSDKDFMKLVAVLRLSVPYTGLILTAREPIYIRDRLIEFGVSQIDAGTNIEIGGYSEKLPGQRLDREQFELNDTRTLAQIIDELVERGQIPSFCTACYRKGRTGEHFMEFSTKGFIKRFCTPNALLTFAEYLENYSSGESKARGWALIHSKISDQGDPVARFKLSKMLEDIRNGSRDLLL